MTNVTKTFCFSNKQSTSINPRLLMISLVSKDVKNQLSIKRPAGLTSVERHLELESNATSLEGFVQGLLRGGCVLRLHYPAYAPEFDRSKGYLQMQFGSLSSADGNNVNNILFKIKGGRE